MLTANSTYVPSQLGPAQSPRQPAPEEEPAAVETGEVTFNWVAPAVREDGTALDSSEIDSYELRFGQTPDLENMQQIADTEQSFYVLRELPLGITHYAALRVRDTGGQISELSNIIEFQAD